MTSAGNAPEARSAAGADAVAKPDRVLPLLRGAVPPALIAGVLATGVGAVLAGGRGVVGAAIGFAVVALFSGGGLLAVRTVRDQDPVIVMVVALGSYVLRIVLFGVALSTASLFEVDSLLDRSSFLIATLATLAGWMGGEIRAFQRMRIPTYDVPIPTAGGSGS